jgi:hypothetical protein
MPTIDPQLVDRPEKELDVTTGDNIIFVIAGKIGLEAVENKILILIDKFRSGYECKDCNETGIYVNCECERKETPGRIKYGTRDKECPYCNGSATERDKRRGATCIACKGTGTTLTMPENARAIPTSGVIVSTGPHVKTRQIGERVLFGAHTGYYLPFKGNAKIRCMREDEILCLIHSLNNGEVLGDFLQVDEIQS